MNTLATFKVENPDEISITATITLRLADWQVIEEALRQGKSGHIGPVHELAEQIYRLTRDAKQTFYGTPKD